MNRIKVIKKDNKIVEWEFDKSIEWDSIVVEEKFANVLLTKNAHIDEIFHFTSDDIPIASHISFLDPDNDYGIAFCNCVAIERKDDEYKTSFYFLNVATYTDEIENFPAAQVLKICQSLALKRDDLFVEMPFEFEDSIEFAISVYKDFAINVEAFFKSCVAEFNSLILQAISYLKKIDDLIEGSEFVIELDDSVKVPITQFLSYFKTYVKRSQEIEIDYTIENTADGIKINFKEGELATVKNIKKWMLEYVSNIDENKMSNNLKSIAELRSTDILKLELQVQVDSLKNSLDIIKLENKYLQKNEQFLQKIISNLSTQNPIILNQHNNEIYSFLELGTKQLESNTSTDRELLKIIYQNTNTEVERQELLDHLKTIRDKEEDDSIIAKAKKSFWSKLGESVSEASKQIIRKAIEYGFENL